MVDTLTRPRDRVGDAVGALTASHGRKHLLLGLFGLVVISIALESLSPFRVSQMAVIAYLGAAAVGLTLLIGLSGQISLGHGALMAFGAYAVALYNEDAGRNPLASIALALIVTLPIGLIVGAAAARLSGPYLAGVTLALALAVPGIPMFLGDQLKGESGIVVKAGEIPTWLDDTIFFIFGNELTSGRYTAYIGWTTLLFMMVLLANLKRSQIGRRWRAVHGDPVAAELLGINLSNARILAFVVSAGCAGIAGALMAMTTQIVAPSGLGVTLSLLLLGAVVIGGLGSLRGAIIGVAILTLLPTMTSNFGRSIGLDDLRAAELAPLAHGSVMILVILFAPRGITGGLALAREWWGRRRSAKFGDPIESLETK